MGEQDSDVKISVVTVCYNSAKTLEQTIRSVIGQKYKNLEYIIIDGGSTDGTLEIIKKYEPYISYWVSEPDKGAYDAMNKGIQAASGKLVSCLNSDDWYFDGVLQRVADTYAETQADLLHGDMCVVDEQGKVLKLLSSKNPQLDRMLYETVIYHPCCFIRTNILKQRPLDIKYPICADEDLFIDLYLKNYKFAYLGEGGITHFRMGGRSSTSSIETPKEYYRIGKKYLKHYRGQPLYADIKQNLRRMRVYPFLLETKNNFTEAHQEKVKKALRGKKIGKVIVFGAGTVGRVMAEMLSKMQIDFAIADNNSKLIGTEVCGKKIISVSGLRVNDGEIVLLANSGHTDGMIEQLREMGLKKDKDFYDFQDWCMYLAYLRYMR